MSATAFLESDAFRRELDVLFKGADVQGKTGLGWDEVEEWLIEDAADFLMPEDGGKMTEASVKAFVLESMDSMAASVMPDKMKEGKAAAEAAKTCIADLTPKVTELFVRHFNATK